MNYIYLGKGDFKNPEKAIVEYQGNYFCRRKNTDWDILDEKDLSSLMNGDAGYYALEDESFLKILSSWGGSKFGYKNQNIHHEVDNRGYGEEYDD